MYIKSLVEKFHQSKFLKDSFWAVFGNGIGNAFFLLAGILIARYLGKDIYGEYGVVKSTMIYIASFATFGLGFTSTKFIAQQVANGGRYIKSIVSDSMLVTFSFSTFIAFLLFSFAYPLSKYVGAESLSLPFRILAAVIIFKALTTTQIGIMSGFKAFKYIAINSIMSGLFMLVACIPLTYYWGLNGSLLCLFLSQVFNFTINYISLKKIKLNLSGQIIRNFKKELIKFSLPVALQESSFTICNWCAIVLLTKYASLGELGLYSAASQWNAIILMIPALLTNVILSYLSSSVSIKSQHKKQVLTMLGINFACTLIPFVIVFVLAGFIASFYGPSFSPVANLLRLLTFATIFECCSSVFKSELMAQGKTWLLFFLRFVRDVTLVTTVFFTLSTTGGENGSYKFSLITVIVSAIFFLTMWIAYRILTKKIN